MAFTVSVAALVVFCSPAAAVAQTLSTPFQIAGELSALGLARNDNLDRGTPGVGLRTDLTLAPDIEVFPNGQVASLDLLARFVNPWQVSTGIGYRFGGQQTVPDPEPIAGRWEIGGDFANTTAFDGYPNSIGFRQIPTLGLFISYRLAPAVYADGVLQPSLRSVTLTNWEGGHLLQALGGAKIGVRQNA